MVEENIDKKYQIKAKSDNRFCAFESGNMELKVGDDVLFESEQGQEAGTVVETSATASSGELEVKTVTLIRKLTDKDKEKLEERAKEAKETLPSCGEKIKKHNLPMDLLGADISYDGKKLTFYFSAPSRIDFRSLVPDLASTFKKLIRLQQVGARDKAKCLGSFGRCGQNLCCKRFLKDDLDSVTMEMACEQNLGQTGSNRVTGACGKLMCCLKFELAEYERAKKKMPKVGSEIKTPSGVGTVLCCNVIKNNVTVELKEDQRRVEVDC